MIVLSSSDRNSISQSVDAGSRFAVGSSRRRTSGSKTSSEARHTFCFSPPLSSKGDLSKR